jgi:hypothetical protein
MTPGERRTAPRLRPCQTRWREDALLRPGQDVVIINVSRGGALIESAMRMAPGARAELQLLGASSPGRQLVRGRISRCHVTRLEPVGYCGAIIFDEPINLLVPAHVA